VAMGRNLEEALRKVYARINGEASVQLAESTISALSAGN